MTGSPGSNTWHHVLDKYRSARVIVIGATGFIGRWVAHALAEVTKPLLVVRDADAASDIFSRYSISGEIAVLDVADFATVTRLIADIRPAIVFNLAGYGVKPAERDPATAQAINAALVRVLCAACAGHSERAWTGLQLVHVGSALEYGMAGGSLSEDTIPAPTTLYGRTKLEGTQALSESCRRLDVRGVTARLFTVYGPGEPEGRLLPSLLSAARGSDNLDLTAGTQLRDFTFVMDVAEGLLRLGVSAARPEPVNLATGRLVSVRQFVTLAAEVLGIAPERLRFGLLPTRAEEMNHDPVSVARLRQLCDWVPATTCEAGIVQTARFEADIRD